MELIRVQVNGACAKTVYCKTITSGMVGAEVTFEYVDPVWDSLQKTAVFCNGDVIKDVVNIGNTVKIPSEVLTAFGRRLIIGVYGVNEEGTLVIPTIWVDVGIICPGADPSGDESIDPTLSVWAQILNSMGSLENLNTEDKSTLVAAINEALTKGGGTITGPINMNGQPITGLNEPTNETEAARKGYVDEAVKKARPQNLLDNSDFTNPVNQRGMSNYAIASYCIDRWYADTSDLQVSITSSGITLKNVGSSTSVLEQRIASGFVIANKKYTLAYCKTDGTIVCGVTTASTTMNVISNAIGLTMTNNGYDRFSIFIGAGSELSLKWVALYEGEYTAETLPEYQPKGYATELAECRRYFKRIGNATTHFVGFGGVLSSANKQVLVTIPGAGGMRTTPTVTASGVVRCFSEISSAYEVSSIVGDGQDNSDVLTVVTMAAELDGGKHYLLRVDSAAYIDVSADL